MRPALRSSRACSRTSGGSAASSSRRRIACRALPALSDGSDLTATICISRAFSGSSFWSGTGPAASLTAQSFLSLLEARCPVIELRSSVDHRRLKQAASLEELNRPRAWFLESEREAFEQAVLNATKGATGAPLTLSVYNRPLHVPWAIDGVARFSFADLCQAVRCLVLIVSLRGHRVDAPALPFSCARAY